jgi:hypothetical protein
MLGINGTEDPLKHIERDDSMMVNRLRGERVGAADVVVPMVSP